MRPTSADFLLPPSYRGFATGIPTTRPPVTLPIGTPTLHLRPNPISSTSRSGPPTLLLKAMPSENPVTCGLSSGNRAFSTSDGPFAGIHHALTSPVHGHRWPPRRFPKDTSLTRCSLTGSSPSSLSISATSLRVPSVATVAV